MLRLTQSNSWNGSTSIQIKGKSLWNVDMILYFCIISLALSECIMYAFDILSQCECEYFHISHLRSREFAMHSNILGIWNWIQATMHDLDRGEIFMDYLKLINFLFHVSCILHSIRAPIESRSLSPRVWVYKSKCLRMEQWIMYVTLWQKCVEAKEKYVVKYTIKTETRQSNYR